MTGTLAANLSNKLDVLHALPLMESAKKAQAFDNTLGVHAIFVPSDLGGRLTVGFGSKHEAPDHVLGVLDPHGTVHKPDVSGHVRIDLLRGKRGHGVFFASVHAKSGKYSIFALFEEIGFAREKDGSHLIPWNFWYWPFADSKKPDTAWGSTYMFPLSHYEKAFKVTGGRVRKWEKEHHNDPTGTRESWEGHCHNSAPASILFQAPPDAGRKHAGVDFSCEELKFYATEFFGRFGDLEFVWGLPGTGPMGRSGPLQENRPSDDPKLFGTSRNALVAFLEALRSELRDKGRALIMDLRDISGAAHAEVWNQAVYQYVTRYWQADPADPHLTEGLTLLSANEDFLPAGGTSSGLPAEVKTIHGEAQAIPNTTGRDQRIRFRLRFENNGKVDHGASDNRWWSVKAGGSDIHAPRFAFRVKRPLATESPSSTGNPHIERANTLALLSLRTKFV
jgi:hypothetical protein